MDRVYDNLGLTTVISRLGLATSNPDAAYIQRHLRRIEVAMPAFNLDPSTAHLAAEIAAFEDSLPAPQRVALITLIVASIVALNEGSTRIPVTGPEALHPMTRILGPLCADPDLHDDDAPAVEAVRSAVVRSMMERIATMLDAGVAASVIARSPDDYRPLIYLPPYLYHQRIRAAEVLLANDLHPRLESSDALASDSEIAAALADVNDRPRWLGEKEIVLSESQLDAVCNAVSRRLALVSGGPGTGKTSIVLAIVRLLVRLGIKPNEIALAAPTGKAAHRMGESIRDGLTEIRNPSAEDIELSAARLEPVTMHRLLGYSPHREIFLHHRNNPLPARIAIIDESSMIDLTLMHRLTAALRPDARMVLLGDADQLPSVAAGAVFRDLAAMVPNPPGDEQTNSLASICTRLSQNYRVNSEEANGRAIYNFAQSVNAGAIDTENASSPIHDRADPAALRFGGIERLHAEGPALDDFIDHWYATQIRDSEIDELATRQYSLSENGFDDIALTQLRRVYNHLAASRILCVTRVLKTGADHINEVMHRRAVAAANRPPNRTRFLAGEPAMMVRNDYDRNLFNGDQGIIVRVRRPDGGESTMVVFMRGDRFEAFHLPALGDALELCYATTIHKAQGSEFDTVAVMMPDRDLPLLTRELLYTAVSRARKSVVLVGSVEMIRAAATRKATRYSGLAELLNSKKTDA